MHQIINDPRQSRAVKRIISWSSTNAVHESFTICQLRSDTKRSQLQQSEGPWIFYLGVISLYIPTVQHVPPDSVSRLITVFIDADCCHTLTTEWQVGQLGVAVTATEVNWHRQLNDRKRDDFSNKITHKPYQLGIEHRRQVHAQLHAGANSRRLHCSSKCNLPSKLVHYKIAKQSEIAPESMLNCLSDYLHSIHNLVSNSLKSGGPVPCVTITPHVSRASEITSPRQRD